MGWGFLGAGWVAARAMAGAVTAAAGARLHAVAARDPARARALAPGVAVHRHYRQLLADPGVEVVYIALPNDAHRSWAVAALQAGRHVLCEKPLALTAAEVDEMAVAARTAGRLLVEASMYRWHPQVQRLAGLLGDDALGAVRHVAAGFSFAGVPAGNYRLDPGHGGGAGYDVGCYPVSAAVLAFGGRPPQRVRAVHRRGGTGVDLTCRALLEFTEGVAEVHASIAEPPRQWLTVTGQRGVLSSVRCPFTAWSGMDTGLLLADREGARLLPTGTADPYRLMVEQVSAAVRGRPAWLLPLADSRTTAAVLDACRVSAAADGAPAAPTPEPPPRPDGPPARGR